MIDWTITMTWNSGDHKYNILHESLSINEFTFLGSSKAALSLILPFWIQSDTTSKGEVKGSEGQDAMGQQWTLTGAYTLINAWWY